MRALQQVLCCAILLSFGGGAVRAAEWVCKSTDQDGLMLTVHVKQNVNWQDAVAVLQVTNLSDQKVEYSHSSILRGFALSMADNQLKPVRLTNEGEKLLKSGSQESTKYSAHQLEPEATITVKVELAKVFLPPEAGQYNLFVFWDKDRLSANANVKLKMEKVVFTVAGIDAVPARDQVDGSEAKRKTKDDATDGKKGRD